MTGPQDVQAAPPASGGSASTNKKYIHVQGKRAITQADKRQLLQLGVTVLEYLAANTYLCRYNGGDLTPIRNLNFVQSVTDDDKPKRLDDTLDGKINAPAPAAPAAPVAAAPAAEQPASQAAGPTTFAVSVIVHNGEEEDIDAIIDDIVERTALERDDISVQYNALYLTASSEDINTIANLSAVRSVQESVKLDFHNEVARSLMFVAEPDDASLKTGKYQGLNQIVTVCDTGFDLGKMSDLHPAFKNRVVALLSLGRKATGLSNDPIGHGTHVAGSVLGDDVSSTMGGKEGKGGKIRGTAPKAKMIMQSIISADNASIMADSALNIWDVLDGAYTRDSRISTNSWGPSYPYPSGDLVQQVVQTILAMLTKQLPYDDNAGTLDRFVWHHPDHVVLFAAGNDGRNGPEVFPALKDAQLGSYCGAKNCITVGAAQSLRATSPEESFDPSARPGDPHKVAQFSSRGPTVEGRIKPDVVAPGTSILSTATRDPTPARRALEEANKNKTPLRKNYSTDPNYAFMSGTSMATPLVAGLCAALREALLLKGPPPSPPPSAALVKALLINGAVAMADVPRAQQGFGMVNLARSLAAVDPATAGRGVVAGFADVGGAAALQEGKVWTKEIAVPAAVGKDPVVKVTMVYTDRFGPAVQNKLVLRVQATKADNTSVSGWKGVDYPAENNVEQVVLSKLGPLSKIVVQVSAERITRLDDSQGFAAVWSVEASVKTRLRIVTRARLYVRNPLSLFEYH